MDLSSDSSIDRKQAARFLYASTFGPKKGDIDNLVNKGYDDWFDEQFNTPPNYHLPLTRQYKRSNKSIGEEERLGVWWKHTIHGKDQLRQRMVFALSQVFVVGVSPQISSEKQAYYYDMLTEHAFGNFRDLLTAVTLSPEMGWFLTYGSLSIPRRYDENYARELMQLFTIGLWKIASNGLPAVDKDGLPIPTYSQNDVEELARVFTGWRIESWFEPMSEYSRSHDHDSKIVLGEYFPEKQTAEQDMEQALDLLFNHANTPFYISMLLIKRFTISNPRRQYIDRVAKAFRDNGYGERGDLKAVLIAILTDPDVIKSYAISDHLDTGRSESNYGRVKEPLITMANLARALDMNSNDPERWWDSIRTEANLGMSPLRADSVFGFYAPDYAPSGEIEDIELTAPEFFIHNQDCVMGINNTFWDAILAYNSTHNNKHWSWDRGDFEKVHEDPKALVELINERLFGGNMSRELISFLKENINELDIYDIDRRICNALYIAVSSPQFRCQE
ncbi:DUF1800 domain-containing protein [Photobacterium sanguinicancri]|uniref:DUF1800 domain-containing protein n=1 Tax=Photobacterium sanguinicancri TaxID=875932 RepID=UPI0021C342B4|nr:DUF1800 domain-containing protein [Photobacterium sanguinicancri]